MRYRSRGLTSAFLLMMSVIPAISLYSACDSSGTFSRDFSYEIQRDCVMTVCGQPAAGTAVNDCVTKTGSALDRASDAQQQYFLDTVVRCESSPECTSYQQCVVTDPSRGYAGAHQPQLLYDCQQVSVCRNYTAQQAATESMACLLITAASVNASVQNQTSFDAMFARCTAANLTGCDWITCRNTPPLW